MDFVSLSPARAHLCCPWVSSPWRVFLTRAKQPTFGEPANKQLERKLLRVGFKFELWLQLLHLMRQPTGWLKQQKKAGHNLCSSSTAVASDRPKEKTDCRKFLALFRAINSRAASRLARSILKPENSHKSPHWRLPALAAVARN